MSNKLNLLTIAVMGALFSASVAAAPVFTGGSGLSSSEVGNGNIAIGNADSKALGTWGLAIGAGALLTGNGSIAIGGLSKVGSIAEDGTVTSVNSAIAMGGYASAQASGSIALGANSVASRAAGSFGNATGAAFATGSSAGKEWVSTSGVVSIGSDSMSRQLTGLAAGSQDDDAVNVAQLKNAHADAIAQARTAAGSLTVFGSGTSTEITPADESNGTPAVLAQNASILGNNGTVKADNGSAFGYNARVEEGATGAIAIGSDSIAPAASTRTAPVYMQGSNTGAAWTADANHGVVSFGGSYTVTEGEGDSATTNTVNFNRQITGVAAGSEDNDAVNVAQLKEVNNQVQGLVTGDTKVSTIQLTSDPEDASAPTIGLRYQVAAAEPVALADEDPVTPTTSQGRLIYNNINSAGAVIGTETIATLSDGFYVKGGNTAADGTGVKVDLNQGISFLGDEYLQTSVTEGENGGAVVTVGASQALKDFLANSGVQPSEPSNPSNPGNSGGNTGGTWNPNAAQQAALNGNFANGITVAAGEGNQAIQIKQGNVDMGGNRIQNVGNPIADGDAANKHYVDSTARSLRNKINDVDKDLRAGVAMAMAVGNLPQAYMPGKSIVGMSAGTYHGQGGFALGLSHATENRQWIIKGAASVDTRGNFGGTLSAGYQF